MSELLFSSIWCAGQVVLLAGLAIGVAVRVTNRRPELASRVTSWTVVGILALTAMIPIPLPDWHLGSTSASVAPALKHLTQTVGETSGDDVLESAAPFPMFQIDFGRLTEVTSTIRSVAPTARKGAGAWWVILLMVGVSIGLLRVGLGLLALWKLRRGAVELARDDAAWVVADSLASGLGLEGATVRLAESEEVGCAAVVGFFKPTVLLAKDWREWEPHELRAVLTHEFAHVARRDALWRFLAVGAGAFHFFNPLVHWLTSRMVLAQELAADRLAIKSMGQGAYVRSLSRLALRQDTSSRVWTQPLFTPVFAGHLMRRIEMLRAKDCERTTNRRWLSSVVLASLVMLGLTTTIARSAVQTQEGKQESGAGETPIRQVSATTDKDSATDKFRFFQRTKVPATHPMFSQWGGLHMSMASLMDVPALAGYLQQAVSQSVEGVEGFPSVDAKTIESITSSIRVIHGEGAPLKVSSVAYRDGSVHTHRRTSLGTLGMAVKMVMDVDWPTVLSRDFTKAEAKLEDGVKFWETPMPFLGPDSADMRLMPTSKRELAMWFPQLGAAKTPAGREATYPGLVNLNAGNTTRAWEAEWNAVCGGVFTVVWTAETREPANPDQDKQDEDAAGLYQNIEGKIDVAAWGIDISPGCQRLMGKVRLRCREGVSGEEVSKQVSAWLKLMEADARKEAPDSPEAITNKLVLDLLTNVNIVVEPNDGGRDGLSCTFEIDVPSALLAAMVSDSEPEKE